MISYDVVVLPLFFCWKTNTLDMFSWGTFCLSFYHIGRETALGRARTSTAATHLILGASRMRSRVKIKAACSR